MNGVAQPDLSDAQWCVLDLLMRARARGVERLHRRELLHAPALPQLAAVQLTWAALTMPTALVAWHGEHEFSLTDAGASLYRLRFGHGSEPVVPTMVADSVICLPGPERAPS